MQEYIIKIKEPSYDELMSSVGVDNLSSYTKVDEALKKMNLLQREFEAQYQERFLKVINDVIFAGGVVLFDKKELSYEWSIFKDKIKIKISENKISFIEKNPQVEYIIKE